MFTGIIEATGKAEQVQRNGRQGRFLTVKTSSKFVRRVSRGDSVAVDGVCLTVTGRARGTLRFEIMDVTLKRTILGARRVGDRVNVELALRANDTVDGHFVTGHVDSVGRVRGVQARGRTRYMIVQIPHRLHRYLVQQGSVAVNGVSLTIVNVGPDWFSVALTSYTCAKTNLGVLKVGNAVNIEVDIFAKYIFNFVSRYEKLSHRRFKVS